MSSLAPMAQLPIARVLDLSGTSAWVAAIIVAVVIVFVAFLLTALRFYKRCPSNRILVVYGKTGHSEAATCMSGGARLVIPLVQDYAWLSLEPMQIEIPLRGRLVEREHPRQRPQRVHGGHRHHARVDAERGHPSAGPERQGDREAGREIIFGQLRQVIASMRIEDINRDRDKFLAHIQKSLEPELRKIGLVLINVNITDITDESGYIEAIGQKAATEAIQKARGDVAENEKMGADPRGRRRAREGRRGGQGREVPTDRHPRGRPRTGRPRGRARQGTAGRRADGRLRARGPGQGAPNATCAIRLADADARAVEGENIAKADIAASQATLQVKKAEAYQIGETKKVTGRGAPCSRPSTLPGPRPPSPRPTGSRPSTVPRWKPRPRPRRPRVEVEADAEAAKRRIEAEGEASAIFARLEAEARGQYEILAKKGDGLKQIVDACGGAQQAFQMLMLEHFDNLVKASAKAISNIKFDKVVVWDGNGSNGTSATAELAARTWPARCRR